MARFRVELSGQQPLEVTADNWVQALHNALDLACGDLVVRRIACELLADGGVIAREVEEDLAIVIQTLEDADGVLYAPVDGLLELHPTTDFTVEVPVPPTIVAETEAVVEQIRAAPVKQAWELAIDAAMSMVPCESAAAFESQDQVLLRFTAARGPKAGNVAGLQVPVGTGIAGFCVQHGMALVVNDTRSDPRFYQSLDRLSGYQTKAVLCVPVGNRGCLELLNPSRAFTRQDLLRVEQLASALAR